MNTSELVLETTSNTLLKPPKLFVLFSEANNKIYTVRIPYSVRFEFFFSFFEEIKDLQANAKICATVFSLP